MSGSALFAGTLWNTCSYLLRPGEYGSPSEPGSAGELAQPTSTKTSGSDRMWRCREHEPIRPNLANPLACVRRRRSSRQRRWPLECPPRRSGSACRGLEDGALEALLAVARHHDEPMPTLAIDVLVARHVALRRARHAGPRHGLEDAACIEGDAGADLVAARLDELHRVEIERDRLEVAGVRLALDDQSRIERERVVHGDLDRAGLRAVADKDAWDRGW